MSLIRSERRAGWSMEPLWAAERIDRIFRDIMRTLFYGEAAELDPHVMRVEEYVEGDTFVVRAELPDVDPDEDVAITIRDGVLHLHAAREEHTHEERPHGFRSEFHYGRIERSLRLPEGVTEADVKAGYKHGILEIRVPLPKEAAPATKIAVEHS
jgi:HSP20 family protein